MNPKLSIMLKKRTLLKDILKHLSNKRYTIITGARQVGKTSLVQLVRRQLEAEKKKVFYLTLEDTRLLQKINEFPEKVFDFIPIIPQPIVKGVADTRIFLILDEIQHAQDPTNFLKFLYDKYAENLKIIATGSSAFYIDKKFKDSLAGRKRIFNLHPLSFVEFLHFKEEDELIADLKIKLQRPNYQSLQADKIQRYFYEYLIYGAYPAIVLEQEATEKIALLNELRNAYIRRDLQESGVEKEDKFFLLLQLLASQIGNLLNRNELSSTLQIDNKTVDSYLYILEKCYHIQIVKPFYRNIRKELTKMPKIYFNDLGLRNAFLNRFQTIEQRIDKGELLENYFINQLKNQYSREQLKFWRTADKQEVDIVIEESFGQGQAYEVKWNKRNFKPTKYKKFATTYPTFPLSCLDATDFYRFIG